MCKKMATGSSQKGKRSYDAFTDWDNSPRRLYDSIVFKGSTPKLFYDSLVTQLNRSQNEKTELFIITAWNEWGEGAYLEPDEKYGYSYLEAVKSAIEHINFPLNRSNEYGGE